MTSLAVLAALFATAADKVTPEQAEFFEKKVRPVLVKHCYSCHSAEAKKTRGGLRVDSREALLKGGDGGPSVVPGKADASKLIHAIRYADPELQMPPRSKLADAEIADLVTWVSAGAPWPGAGKPPVGGGGIDIEGRKAAHWSWKPVRTVATPAVRDASWPLNHLDRFVLAGLEANGLRPAGDTDRGALLRRLHLDLTGLPPSAAEVTAFVEDTSPRAVERVVDRLLASPAFGERWARHWLDLVRYAETRGHEFDPTIPGAYHYRDAMVRAFNDDVPYDRMLREHLAGDLLPDPRRHPVTGANESLKATAFWFLGEEVHSPVDVRADQADRFDNRIDVMTKTFLGLTVACARCHDHKFDAIGTKDYYALYGVLSSSGYRLARVDTIAADRETERLRVALVAKHRRDAERAVARAVAPAFAKLFGAMRQEAAKPGALADRELRAWLDAAKADVRDPLHPLAAAMSGGKVRPAPAKLAGDVIADYADAKTPFIVDDVGYGSGPRRVGEAYLDGGRLRLSSRAAAHAEPFWRDRKRSHLGENDHGSIGGVVRAGATLRTPSAKLTTGRLHALVRGKGLMVAGVGSHVLIVGPLHGRLVQGVNTPDAWRWVTHDLTTYKGLDAHLEFSPAPGHDLAVAMVVQAEHAPAVPAPEFPALAEGKTPASLIDAYEALAANAVKKLEEGALSDAAGAALIDAVLARAEALGADTSAAAAPLAAGYADLAARVKPASHLMTAIMDGGAIDEPVFVRGSPKSPGVVVPRRNLTALGGEALTGQGSGRLQLANQLADPARNPFLTRVMVNRIWHHLIGRGIVPSVDDFGVMGQAPTHPELLDRLAADFAARGFSIKATIREIVLSRTYRLSTQGDPDSEKADPENRYRHRADLRRLSAEAVRDSLLALSGTLDRTAGGPSIPVHLTEFQQGRGRPGSGPLDGAGRRSVYLGVRRNFLSSFLLAFDAPQPFSTVGRRSVSNVPAQSLILMNDPFVHQQAKGWSARAMKAEGDVRGRISRMWLEMCARGPTAQEMRECEEFVGAGKDEKAWAELAHALVNVKEFLYLR